MVPKRMEIFFISQVENGLPLQRSNRAANHCVREATLRVICHMQWMIRRMTNHHVPGKQSQVVRLAAQPEPIEMDLTTTAVLVIDMQNDFGSKGGMFDRAEKDISGDSKCRGLTANVLAAGARRASRSSTSRWDTVPIYPILRRPP